VICATQPPAADVVGAFIFRPSAGMPISVYPRVPAVVRRADKRRYRPVARGHDRERACPLRADLAVNLLAHCECVSGAVRFFHSRCLDHPTIAHKRTLSTRNSQIQSKLRRYGSNGPVARNGLD
jgi:hypothetical protein